MKVHYIASGEPERAVTTSCLRSSAGGGIITMKVSGGKHVYRFARLRRSFSDPVQDFLATTTETLVDCRNCRRHI